MCRKVSLWTLGHENGKVTIYAGQTDVRTLITDCARGISSSPNKGKDLTERNIVLYPSHGLYYNRDRAEWIWQRATLWTTVEDLYSQEYVRHITRMLENAGANVLSPRAGLDERHPGLSGMPRWTEGARYWSPVCPDGPKERATGCSIRRRTLPSGTSTTATSIRTT